ncbi:wall-associated receptor kinase-like 2 isoform X1 [Phaseolus vulgaris]|uniref:wall-associated receptor kinase-like 2 isoform X1 n=1 Tax=Phaseolus vulgaris TaxID=3885 RepID=UPI0035CA5AF2
MILKFLIHFIILAIWKVSAQVGLSVGKPGCDWRCGNVPIPFPFGMKSFECYAGKWFEIECRNSTYTNYTHTPYLKSIGVEVISINLQLGTVNIKNPIYRSNCGSKDSPPVNKSLEGSPFVYSQKYNKFMAAGCNIIAILQLNRSEVSGCVSICDENYKVGDIGKMDFRKSDCNGKSCCDSSLPLYLKEYSTEIKGLKDNETSDECSYAMVVQQHLAYSYRSSSYNDPKTYYFIMDGEMKDLDVVPVVLEWEILNNLNLTLPLDHLSHCDDTNVTSSSGYKRSGQRCYCQTGSVSGGNPYVEGGCPDYYPNYRKSPRPSITKGLHICTDVCGCCIHWSHGEAIEFMKVCRGAEGI